MLTFSVSRSVYQNIALWKHQCSRFTGLWVFWNRTLVCDVEKQSPGGVLWEKVVLEISENSQENACVRVSFSIKLQAKACNSVKKEILALLFSSKFCEISKNTSGQLLLDINNNILMNLSFFSCLGLPPFVQAIWQYVLIRIYEGWKWGIYKRSHWNVQ